MNRHAFILFCLSLLFAGSIFGQTSQELLRGIGVDDRLPGEPLALEALSNLEPGGNLSDALFVRLLVPRSALEAPSGEYTFQQLDSRIDAYHDLGIKIFITFWDPPSSPDETEPWRELVLSLAQRYRGRVLGYILGTFGESATRPDPKAYSYILKLTATQINSRDPDALIVEGHAGSEDAQWLESLSHEGVSPYLDAFSITPTEPMENRRAVEDLKKIQAVLSEADPSSKLLVTGIGLGEDVGEAQRRLLISEFIKIEVGATLCTYSGKPEVLGHALSAASVLGEHLTNKVVPMADKASSLRIEIGGVDHSDSVPHKLLFDVDTGSTYLAYWADRSRTYPSRELDVELSKFVPDAPLLRDPISGQVESLQEVDWNEDTMLSRARVPLRDHPLLLVFPSINMGTTVAAKGLMSVNEIIARHQRSQAAQDNSVRHYSSSVRTEIHFRPSAADSGFDVVTESNFYHDRRGSEWEELTFSINGARWGEDRPSFPMLQPEKVLSLPLNLQLNQDYVYRLEGQARLGDRLCYVVEFEPLSDSRSLYQGKVWIDAANFAKLKVQAVQTNLAGPVSSNEETHLYAAAHEIEDQQLHLLSSLTSRQLFLIAGRNILVERVIRFSGHKINSPDFNQQRQAARSSNRVMFKDTDEGLRYFVKRGGERIVSDKLTKTATALAMGTTIDPAFDYPLPIVGISHLDFDFLERDIQFSLLFGGVVAFGNLQKKGLFGAPFDWSIDFSGIAVRGNDQVFNENGEIEQARLRTRPFALGVNFGWQFTDFQKILAGYQFSYNDYAAAETTSELFVVPTNTVTNGASVGYEFSRSGYFLAASASYAKRANWEPWGNVSSFDPETQSYIKYQATLGKDFFWGLFHKLHFDVGYFGGERLDRLTMYQPGLFDKTRIHGVPSAAVRFTELVVVRGSYSFNILEQYRFDLSVDQGFGKDPTIGGDLSSLTGIGVGLNLRGPWSTLIRTDFGKSFLPEVYRSAGSVVVQILVMKPF